MYSTTPWSAQELLLLKLESAAHYLRSVFCVSSCDPSSLPALTVIGSVLCFFWPDSRATAYLLSFFISVTMCCVCVCVCFYSLECVRANPPSLCVRALIREPRGKDYYSADRSSKGIFSTLQTLTAAQCSASRS